LKYYYLITSIVFLDQFTKVLVKRFWINNNYSFHNIKIIGDYLRLTFIENPGIAFGIDTSDYHLLITICTITAVIILFYYVFRLSRSNESEILPFSFILGGAIGNAIDRFLVLFPQTNYNGVIDFIDIGVMNFRWYIFNFADISISIGLFILVYQTIIRHNNDKKANI